MLSGVDLADKPRPLRTDPAGRQIPSLIRAIDLAAYWAAHVSATDLDLTVDPEAPATRLGPAGGIYSTGGGDVALEMSGSTTTSILTLATAGSREVSIVRILKTGTTATTIEVSW